MAVRRPLKAWEIRPRSAGKGSRFAKEAPL